MELLKKTELCQVHGGGYWWRDSAGFWHYSTDDEEPEGDDVIWG